MTDPSSSSSSDLIDLDSENEEQQDNARVEEDDEEEEDEVDWVSDEDVEEYESESSSVDPAELWTRVLMDEMEEDGFVHLHSHPAYANTIYADPRMAGIYGGAIGLPSRGFPLPSPGFGLPLTTLSPLFNEDISSEAWPFARLDQLRRGHPPQQHPQVEEIIDVNGNDDEENESRNNEGNLNLMIRDEDKDEDDETESESEHDEIIEDGNQKKKRSRQEFEDQQRHQTIDDPLLNSSSSSAIINLETPCPSPIPDPSNSSSSSVTEISPSTMNLNSSSTIPLPSITKSFRPNIVMKEYQVQSSRGSSPSQLSQDSHTSTPLTSSPSHTDSFQGEATSSSDNGKAEIESETIPTYDDPLPMEWIKQLQSSDSSLYGEESVPLEQIDGSQSSRLMTTTESFDWSPDIPPPPADNETSSLSLPTEEEYQTELIQLSKLAWGAPPVAVLDQLTEDDAARRVETLRSGNADSLKKYVSPFNPERQQSKRRRITISSGTQESDEPFNKRIKFLDRTLLSVTYRNTLEEDRVLAKRLGGWEAFLQVKDQIAATDRDLLERLLLDLCCSDPSIIQKITDRCIQTSERNFIVPRR